MRVARAIGLGLAGTGGAAGLYLGTVTGALTVDLGIGRRTRPLGPITVTIRAPRQRVFAAAAAPYAERQTRAMREKVQILERAGDMIVAAHRTPIGGRLTAVTVETVVLNPPEQIRFRLLRGPVPQVEEIFAFVETDSTTTLTYTGILGTDLWVPGQRWGNLVARTWENTVRASLDQIKAEAERTPASLAMSFTLPQATDTRPEPLPSTHQPRMPETGLPQLERRFGLDRQHPCRSGA